MLDLVCSGCLLKTPLLRAWGSTRHNCLRGYAQSLGCDSGPTQQASQASRAFTVMPKVAPVGKVFSRLFGSFSGSPVFFLLPVMAYESA